MGQAPTGTALAERFPLDSFLLGDGRVDHCNGEGKSLVEKSVMGLRGD
jgi:hypothetical protein